MPDPKWPPLKVCPFCGTYDLATTTVRMHVRKTDFWTGKIYCRGCWAEAHGKETWTLEEAIASAAEAWNRRYGEPT